MGYIILWKRNAHLKFISGFNNSLRTSAAGRFV